MHKHHLPNLIFIGGWGFSASIWEPLLKSLPPHTATFYAWNNLHFLNATNRYASAFSPNATKPLLIAWSLGAFLLAKKLIMNPEIKNGFCGAVLLAITPRFARTSTTKASLRAMKTACKKKSSTLQMLHLFAKKAAFPKPDLDNSQLFNPMQHIEKSANSKILIAGLEILESINLAHTLKSKQQLMHKDVPTTGESTKSTFAERELKKNYQVTQIDNNSTLLSNFSLTLLNGNDDIILNYKEYQRDAGLNSGKGDGEVNEDKKEKVIWENWLKENRANHRILQCGHLLPVQAKNTIAKEVEKILKTNL